MAFSSTITAVGVMGDVRYEIHDWVAGTDSSGTVVTGLAVVTAAFASNTAAATAPRLQLNTNGSGASNGSVKITPQATSDTGQLIVYGK